MWKEWPTIVSPRRGRRGTLEIRSMFEDPTTQIFGGVCGTRDLRVGGECPWPTLPRAGTGGVLGSVKGDAHLCELIGVFAGPPAELGGKSRLHRLDVIPPQFGGPIVDRFHSGPSGLPARRDVDPIPSEAGEFRGQLRVFAHPPARELLPAHPRLPLEEGDQLHHHLPPFGPSPSLLPASAPRPDTAAGAERA